jgi:hypothetical protein
LRTRDQPDNKGAQTKRLMHMQRQYGQGHADHEEGREYRAHHGQQHHPARGIHGGIAQYVIDLLWHNLRHRRCLRFETGRRDARRSAQTS